MRDFGKSRSNFDPEEETQGGGLANRLVQWLSQQVGSGIAYNEYLNTYEAHPSEVQVEKANVAKVVGYHWPNVDLDAKQDNNFIHLWLDSKSRRAGRSGRTMMRVGRAFRRMFPCLTDSEIDGLVTKFKRDFAPISFTLFESKDSDRFAHAYGHEQSRTENLETTSWHKSIANSCMRHDFDHLDCHPASAYGSGDFTILWTEDNNGKIGSRCVVYTGSDPEHTPKYGPIYAATKTALDMTIARLAEMKAIPAEYNAWEGAKLKAIPKGRGFIAPYIDISPRHLEVLNSDFLVVHPRGSIDASNYSGVLGNCLTCYECDSEIDEDNSFTEGSHSYCESCHSDLFFHCEQCEESYHNHEFNSVNAVTRWGTTEVSWCDHCTHCEAIETINGELWASGDTLQTIDGDVISQRDYDDSYFTSDWDGEIYHIDDLRLTVDGDSVSASELEASPDKWWKSSEDGLWHRTPAEQEELNLEQETVE
jgi:hypothetical protein